MPRDTWGNSERQVPEKKTPWRTRGLQTGPLQTGAEPGVVCVYGLCLWSLQYSEGFQTDRASKEKEI